MQTYLFSILLAFGISLLFCALLIPILRRLKAGQNILSYVKEHKNKSGTPTMGGLAFISAAIIAWFAFSREIDRVSLLTIVIGLSYLVVGLIDDFLKRKHKQNLGLRAWQKFAFQTLIALFSAAFCIRMGLTKLYIPFTKQYIEMGFWTFPLVVFVFLATVNAVNLTDGLDGLAAGTCTPFFVVIGVLIALQKGNTNVSTLSFCLAGALMAYLLFNTSPASVFMGDTGSLSLGGFISCVCCFTGNALYVAVVGLVFVFSVISVVMQVIYYKASKGKRIFLMSPIHHHFQKKGYSESKISYAYAIITTLLGIAVLAFAV